MTTDVVVSVRAVVVFPWIRNICKTYGLLNERMLKKKKKKRINTLREKRRGRRGDKWRVKKFYPFPFLAATFSPLFTELPSL